MRNKHKQYAGFTIVELLIVIVVIGILVVLVMNTFAQVQTKARATSLADGLNKMEKSLKAYAIESSISTWWLDTDNALLGGGNTNFTNIIANNPGFANYLKQVPTVPGLPSTAFVYDNSNDVYNGCANNNNGVNIIVRSLDNQAVALEVDKIKDDGVSNCGKIRYVNGTGNLVYGLSNDQEFK